MPPFKNHFSQKQNTKTPHRFLFRHSSFAFRRFDFLIRRNRETEMLLNFCSVWHSSQNFLAFARPEREHRPIRSAKQQAQAKEKKKKQNDFSNLSHRWPNGDQANHRMGFQTRHWHINYRFVSKCSINFSSWDPMTMTTATGQRVSHWITNAFLCRRNQRHSNRIIFLLFRVNLCVVWFGFGAEIAKRGEREREAYTFDGRLCDFDWVADWLTEWLWIKFSYSKYRRSQPIADAILLARLNYSRSEIEVEIK